MVGQLIRLKLRIIWNTVRRQTAVLVLAILGTLQFGTMYVGALVGTAFLAQSEGAATLAAVLPIVGPVVFLLWLILPILFSAMDNSLDPVRLSPYVGPSKRLGAALAASTAVGPGGLLSAMALFVPTWFALWRAQWVEALGWLLAGIVTLPLAVLWARVVGTWFAVRLDSSGKKDTLTMVGFVTFFVVLTPLGYWMKLLSESFSAEVFYAGMNVALWTPVGAPFGVIASLLEGAWVAAAIRVLITVATAVVGWRAWLAVLRPVMSGYAGPISADAQRAIDEGRHLMTSPSRRTREDSAPRNLERLVCAASIRSRGWPRGAQRFAGCAYAALWGRRSPPEHEPGVCRDLPDHRSPYGARGHRGSHESAPVHRHFPLPGAHHVGHGRRRTHAIRFDGCVDRCLIRHERV